MHDRIEDFVYDKNLVDYAQSLLDEIRSDVTDTDYLLYDAVMKIGYANGFENVEATNSSYDIRNVEKLMEQCRDQTTNLSSTLEDQIGVIEGFLYDSPTDSKLLKNTTTSVNTATSSSSSSTANRVGDGVNQLMYDPPSNTSSPPAEPPSDSEGPPVQALYGPPNDPVQVLYGPPSEPKSNEVPVVQLPNNDVPKGATAVINDSIPVIRDGVSAQETFAPSGQAPGQEPSQPQQPSAPSGNTSSGQSNNATN